MVATREDIRARKHRLDLPTRKPRAPRWRPPVHVTQVNDYAVTTNASGETVATIEGGSALEFRGPQDLGLPQLHMFACRFLERRGPGYAPRTSLVITLDGRGRKRDSVEV